MAGALRLERLDLYKSDVTKEMLVRLGGVKELRFLGLDDTVIIGADFEGMIPLPGLRELRLGRLETSCDARGIAAVLKCCPNLESINFNAGDLDLSGYACLAEFKQLRNLRMTGIKNLKNSQVAALARLRSLRLLELYESSITDAQVALLAPLRRSLEELHLGKSRITDACVPSLRVMKSLSVISIKETDISKGGCEALRRALPSCRVDY